MDIPPILESQIREGKVVLFLGAGASLNTKDAKGNKPPSGSKLAAMLSDKFLGSRYKDLPLNQVGEYAISESDPITVQGYIREVFEGFLPSDAHRQLTSFRWWGIATTNYDLVLEKAYETTPDTVQLLRPFIENGDRVEDRLRDVRSLMYLKLHGCISRITNPDCPLILTTDQYIEYRKGRYRIFEHLKDWAVERTIIFIGHGLQDSDIRTMLLELTAIRDNRPRYFAVSPDVDDIQGRFWETKKVTLLKGTFDEFVTSIASSIPSPFRGLTIPLGENAPAISERFRIKDPALSISCSQFIKTDVEYVKAVNVSETVSAVDFYKGLNPGWSAVEQGLDVRRHLADTILADNFLIEESEHLNGLEIILVKAHAGAGKSVLLRRIAWDAARDYNCLCLYIQPFGVINTAALQELISLCNERIYLFVDDAADRVRELHSLAKHIGPEGKQLTVILAERINEWNVSCEAISPYVTSTYELKYLSEKEIDLLIHLLDQHRALGTLERLSPEERREAFAEHAGRQLLVALHEATLGKRFEEIIEDEYKNIQPAEAQRLYLSICVLNRLNVPVRAGIISRIHGIPFSDFKHRLFAPLEHIVRADYDPIIRDYMYRARHPHIADIVFNRILNTQEERYDSYIRCLRELNVDYSVDYRAFRQMVRGRSLLEMFSNHELNQTA